MHSFVPLNSLSGPAKLDHYTHDPELLQDPIQIGDYVKVHRGPHRGLHGRISWVQHPILWVYPLKQEDNTACEGLGPKSVGIHVKHTHIEPPVTLKFSSQSGSDVTIGNLVRVVHGKYYDTTGIVLSVDFREASMEIQCNGFCVCIAISSLSFSNHIFPASHTHIIMQQGIQLGAPIIAQRMRSLGHRW